MNDAVDNSKGGVEKVQFQIPGLPQFPGGQMPNMPNPGQILRGLQGMVPHLPGARDAIVDHTFGPDVKAAAAYISSRGGVDLVGDLAENASGITTNNPGAAEEGRRRFYADQTAALTAIAAQGPKPGRTPAEQVFGADVVNSMMILGGPEVRPLLEANAAAWQRGDRNALNRSHDQLQRLEQDHLSRIIYNQPHSEVAPGDLPSPQKDLPKTAAATDKTKQVGG